MRNIKPVSFKNIRAIAGTLILALMLLPACDDDNSTNTEPDAAFQSSDLSEGNTFSYTFENEATVDYYCENHPNVMTGEIVVSSDAQNAETDTVEMVNTTFQPSSLTIAPNTEVVWINRDTDAHTVTQGQPSTGGDDDDSGYDY